MSAKWIYGTVACVVPLIFAGNAWVVRNAVGGCNVAPGPCQCVVKLVKPTITNPGKTPSCSVKLSWTPGVSGASTLTDCEIVEPGSFNRTIMCDVGIRALLTCKDKPKNGLDQTKSITIAGGTAMQLECDKGLVSASHDSSWVNNVGKKDTNNPKSGLAAGLRRMLAKWAAGDDDPPIHRILTETELITLVNGDLGLEKDGNNKVSVTLTSGQATVEGLCAGTLTTITGPTTLAVANDLRNAAFTLALLSGTVEDPAELLKTLDYVPCDTSDLTGKWRGAYARKNGPAVEAVPIVLNIRGKTGTVEVLGETLDITELGSTIRAKARTGSGQLDIRATVTKGGMRIVCDVSALGPDGKGYSSGVGFVDRIYIAQWAVPNAAMNKPYQHQLVAISPAGGDLVWRVAAGELPSGIALDGATGLLSGSATATGDFKFTVEVADKNGDTFQQALTLNVKKLVLTTTMLPDAVPGQPYSLLLQAAGGQPPYTFDSMLPYVVPGMTQLSPTGEVTFDPAKSDGLLMFHVSDGSGATESFALEIKMRKLTIATSAFLPPAMIGVPYSHTLSTIGASGAVTWSTLDDLAGSGLTFNTQTGELSGIPAIAGVSGLDVTAEDESNTLRRTFYLTINNPDGTAPSATVASCGACQRKR